MIEELLPECVVTVEEYGDDDPGNASLYPEEEALLAQAVAKRRREFTVVRSCARRAMEKIGVPPQPILPGERGAPTWPEGLAGSMTHCDGYCAAALVRTADLATLGIDAEPHQPLPDGILDAVCLPTEEERLRRLALDHPDVHWDRLLFSAKESVYKAWYPLTGKLLDFTETDINVVADSAEQHSGGFRARLLVPGPSVGDRRLDLLEGRWAVQQGLVATAVSVPHA
ncbi:4'-phosphopantetheinyl transferase superfamily protein [Streptomyces sp. NPDC047082]|uniref:4'-phosphopantetheinyl transferase family protein n=1 Tax=Streptomyces sp. NPDC047082 TaxID=3155259 RepID=UPI0033DE5973